MENKIMTLDEISSCIEQDRALIAVCSKTGKKSTPCEVVGDLIRTELYYIPYCYIEDGVFEIYPVSR